MSNVISIFDPKGMAKSMRHTEYKSIVSAISELVDNSIEAKAKNVMIYLVVSLENDKETIHQVCVLDDGTGMNDQTLHECLVFGKTNSNESSIIGKFGVGLGQASLFAAPKVYVYSWQDHINNSKYVYLDTHKMISGAQVGIEEPKQLKIPRVLRDYVESNKAILKNYINSGTCIFLDGVDKFEYKRVSRNIDQIITELSRRFRYFIHNGVKIQIVTNRTGINLNRNVVVKHQSLIGNITKDQVYLVDPLFLMDDSNVKAIYSNNGATLSTVQDLNYKNAENIFEVFTDYGAKENFDENGVYHYLVSYLDSYSKKVEFYIDIKASVVKNKFYYGQPNLKKSPGDTPIGKKMKEYTGISVLRSFREIEYGNFGIYEEVNVPTHRWWGLELNFNPNGDNFFNLSNNKQHVIFPKKLILKSNAENNNGNDSFEQAWLDLVEFLNKIVSRMLARNKKCAKEFIPSVPPKHDVDGNGFDIVDNPNIETGRAKGIGYIDHLVDRLINGEDKNSYKNEKKQAHTVDYTKFSNYIDNIKIAKDESDDLILFKFVDGKYQILFNETCIYYPYYAKDESFLNSLCVLKGILYSCLYDNYNPGNASFVRKYIEYLNKILVEKGGVISE